MVVIDMVRTARANGTAIVAICHDADVRDAIADRLFTMNPHQDAA
jgi:alpha-D-ribose 1-methylphosphonate 5-triphosphate synthase subunit PhnL